MNVTPAAEKDMFIQEDLLRILTPGEDLIIQITKQLHAIPAAAPVIQNVQNAAVKEKYLTDTVKIND